MVCFSEIILSEPQIQNTTVKSKITLNKIDGGKSDFTLMLKYENKINEKNMPLIKLAFIMPLLNYGLFSKKIKLEFPLNISDSALVEELNKVFSKDIFVNKILKRRTNYISPEYLTNKEHAKANDAKPKATIQPLKKIKDEPIVEDLDKNICGVLSSGGKESLLTYAMLKEIGCNVHPLYVNESGGHWRTALSAYRYHKKIDSNTRRVWTNVDRFYIFMLDNLKFIRSDHRTVWADTYPIRLCIFPYYVFSLLPIFAEEKIGNLLIGSEFDDLRSTPDYLGIKHYYGIYDQHQDYDEVMNKWYSTRMPGLIQWSAVRNISGLIVERILVKRYPDFAKYQRSCHSCHFEGDNIVPCGRCSKCMGILLFLLANKTNPELMNFKKEDIKSFADRVSPSNLRLDQDEKNQSFYLIGKKDSIPDVKPVDHVEKIHVENKTCDLKLIPDHLRTSIMGVIKGYTTGYCELKNEKWVSIDESKIKF